MVIIQYSQFVDCLQDPNFERVQLGSDVLKLISTISNQVATMSGCALQPSHTTTTSRPKYTPKPISASTTSNMWNQSQHGFKATKIIDKSGGVESSINQIRNCMNKITKNNYDTLKDQIVKLITEEIFGDNPDNVMVCEDDLESDKNNAQAISKIIFDIASTNRFYAKIYAELYKELATKFTMFQPMLCDFLLQFNTNILELKYVSPQEDYDKSCQYNKQNDRKKATTSFVVQLMLNGTIGASDVHTILCQLLTFINEWIHMENKINEVEEMTELVNIFVTEGMIVSKNIGDWHNTIRDISLYKIKEKKSMSSRMLFKYVDMVKAFPV